MTAVDLSGLDVLVVDDHAPMRRILKSVLEQFGITKVREADDGAAALMLFNTYRPDIIITDYRMAPMDGVELTVAVREGRTELDSFTPIIMVSAYTEMDRIFTARDAGINEFLAKPISS
jgi:CheY-like chemotaxis protein